MSAWYNVFDRFIKERREDIRETSKRVIKFGEEKARDVEREAVKIESDVIQRRDDVIKKVYPKAYEEAERIKKVEEKKEAVRLKEEFKGDVFTEVREKENVKSKKVELVDGKWEVTYRYRDGTSEVIEYSQPKVPRKDEKLNVIKTIVEHRAEPKKPHVPSKIVKDIEKASELVAKKIRLPDPKSRITDPEAKIFIRQSRESLSRVSESVGALPGVVEKVIHHPTTAPYVVAKLAHDMTVGTGKELWKNPSQTSLDLVVTAGLFAGAGKLVPKIPKVPKIEVPKIKIRKVKKEKVEPQAVRLKKDSDKVKKVFKPKVEPLPEPPVKYFKDWQPKDVKALEAAELSIIKPKIKKPKVEPLPELRVVKPEPKKLKKVEPLPELRVELAKPKKPAPDEKFVTMSNGMIQVQKIVQKEIPVVKLKPLEKQILKTEEKTKQKVAQLTKQEAKIKKKIKTVVLTKSEMKTLSLLKQKEKTKTLTKQESKVLSLLKKKQKSTMLTRHEVKALSLLKQEALLKSILQEVPKIKAKAKAKAVVVPKPKPKAKPKPLIKKKDEEEKKKMRKARKKKVEVWTKKNPVPTLKSLFG